MTPNSLELQRHALDYWQIIRNRLGLILLCFLLVFAVAAIITYIMPRKYRGHVEMVIERNVEDARIVGHMGDALNMPTDNFLKTQFEIISKRKTLDRVVSKMDLMKRWELPGPQYAAAKLLGNLDAKSSIKSDFITIEYFDEDPKLAADIANSIAESYKETRLEVDNQRTDNAVNQLTAQITVKEQLTTQALSKMIEIKKRLGIVEMPSYGNQMARGSDVVDTVQNSTLITAEQDVYKLQKDISDMGAQIQQLQKLEGEELINQAGELRVENDTIRKMAPAYQELKLQLQSLSSAGLGSKHPTMLGIAGQIAQTRTMLLEAAEAYRRNLDFRLTTAKKQLVEAEGLNQDQRDKSIEAQASNQEYLKAKKDWELLELELAKLKDTKAQREIDKQMSKTPVTVYQPAEPETKPYKPNVPLNLAIGGAVGLMFGFGLAFFLEYLDTSVKSIDDVERLLGVPVLAVIPKDVGILHRTSGMNPDAEAYRILRTNLEFNRKDPNANVISVVSGGAGEGKSTTMVNLATVCAQGGYTTLIIDGDLRRPRMHTYFDVPNNFGLSNFLTTQVALEEVVMQTPVENLFFLPSGIMPADSAGLLNSKRFTEMLADVKSRFDIVLIDSPPILGVSDASVLAAEADLTMIVVQHRKLPRQMLQRVKMTVEGVGGKVIGVVLNNVDVRSDSTYGYYTSYYSYYSGDNRSDGSMKPGRKTSKREQTRMEPVVTSSAAPRNKPGDDVF
jgi:polysaccharide biosynthesis transport protein